MKSAWCQWFVFCTSTLLLLAVNGDVHFQFDTEQCLDQLVEYQCSVTGGATLRWRILVNGIQMGSSQVFTDDSNSEAPATIGGGEFTVERLKNSPLVSNISFTVQSSINGYTIQCEGGGETEQFNISIPDIPSAPGIVTVNSSTFTSSSVDIYWTESLSSSSICFAGYNYTVSSAALDNSIVMNVADSTSTTLNNLVPSFADIYTVEVVAVDVADRSSSTSNSAQFLFSAPTTVFSLVVINETVTNFTYDVSVMWKESSFTVASDVIAPYLTGYKVTLINSTDPCDYSNQSDLLPPGTTEHVFYGVPRGRTFIATVTAINSVGMNSTSIDYDAPGPFFDLRPKLTTTLTSSALLTLTSSLITIPTSVTETIVKSTTSSSAVSVCSSPAFCSTANSLSSSVAAGISVAITVPVTAVISVIVTVIVMYVCGYQRANKHSEVLPRDYEAPVNTTSVVEMKTNTAYGQYTAPTDKQQTSTTGTVGPSMYEIVSR